jgi:tight adherence protein B
MDTPYWIFLGLAGSSTGGLVWGLYGLWRQYLDPRQRALAQRLKPAAPSLPPEQSLKLRPERLLSATPTLQRWLHNTPGMQALDHFLLQTGLPMSVAQVLALAMGLVLLTVVVGIRLSWPTLLTLALAVLVVLALTAYLQHRRSRRMALIGQALPDALDLIARSMQAGHAFTSALHLAAKDSPAPLSLELRTVFEEINFGVGSAQALQALSVRVASDDVRYFVVAVVIQSETGGNLADILKNTANLIRERQKMAGVVRVLSAEGRISALVLSLLPFVLAAFMRLLNPGFISKLWTDPMGLQLVYVSLTLMAIGILWMWKMIQIRV